MPFARLTALSPRSFSKITAFWSSINVITREKKSFRSFTNPMYIRLFETNAPAYHQVRHHKLRESVHLGGLQLLAVSALRRFVTR